MHERIRVHHRIKDFFVSADGADWHDPSAQRFSDSQNIWDNVPMFHTPQLARSSETRLNFIRNEENTIFFCRRTYAWPKIIGRDNRSRLTLDRLEHHCSHTDANLITNFELLLYSFRIPKRNMIDLPSIHLS